MAANRINRNILECKAEKRKLTDCLSCVLIETYWNVKEGVFTVLNPVTGINRNILECKVKWMGSISNFTWY